MSTNQLPEPKLTAALEQSHCLPPHQPPPARIPSRAGAAGGWQVTQPRGCWVVPGTAWRCWEMPQGGQAASASWGAVGKGPWHSRSWVTPLIHCTRTQLWLP